ncbi:hypothetical protein EXVG_00403 [Emiliania huxleyi virus 202]|nr:hypothetical protein EXVG_00403 [Emiliania huxleyi virus 202]AHA54361.1 hypothetical protein EhV18_00315 [Emiliania huxleyi virus 18]AHA55400.1 hypothetical protein EhV156_00305 [Emiliania huxleyi virus 156]
MDILSSLYGLVYEVVCCGFCVTQQALEVTESTVTDGQRRASSIPSNRNFN